jgi:hypothetical protein
MKTGEPVRQRATHRANFLTPSLTPSRLVLVPFLFAALLCMASCSGPGNTSPDSGSPGSPATPGTPTNPDTNGDGAVNILVLGTNASISGAAAFSPDQIATELNNILSDDGSNDVLVNVVAKDIHTSKPVTLGLGQNGADTTYTHHSHSLAQYYYWPEGRAARWANLSGEGDFVWDYVVIGADPYMVSTLPGYYALGVHKIAAKVAAGGAQPLLLMMWPKDDASDSLVDHFEAMTQRTAKGASVDLEVVPAGRAWQALDASQRDAANLHPTPNGAYLAAATIYAHIANQSAAVSGYDYDDELAKAGLNAVANAGDSGNNSESAVPVSPFSSCDIDEEIISYNHTGSSSERGILGGLNWVFEQAPETLQNGGESPINFNYGRANSNFEANKRYQVDPARFGFSLGFPMQDNGNYGDESMLYGLDKRDSGTMNDTDLGVARFMVEQSELPHARAVPIRTLFAQMREAMPEQSAYRDAWHMHSDLDKATGAYIYTLLTGKCVLGGEPADQESANWRTWVAHKIGYETAWTLLHLEAAPGCD